MKTAGLLKWILKSSPCFRCLNLVATRRIVIV
jgi:hypothetical protein